MKVILLGSNGMLGTYIKQYLASKVDVVPLSRSDIDLTLTESKILDHLSVLVDKNDVIINAAGAIKQRSSNIEDVIMVNSILPHVLNKIKNFNQCEVIHITTDCVFSGVRGNYNEHDLHDCTDEYGKTKSLGENQNNTNIRTSIIGEENLNKHSLIEWIKSNRNKEITGYDNHLWNGVTCLHLAEIIYDIIREKGFWQGTRHVYSPEIVSKYEIACMINEIYDLNIGINKGKTPTHCFRNLNSVHSTMSVKSIYQQIQEQKKFGDIHDLFTIRKHNSQDSE